MQDFRVKSGLQVSGNVYGVNYLTTDNITVNYTGTLANLIVRGTITGNVVGTVSSLGNHTTSNLTEGTNQYFTNVRVLQAVDPKLTTANVAELTNLYFTNARVYSNIEVMSINTLADVHIANNEIGFGLLWNGNTWSPARITVDDTQLANIANNVIGVVAASITANNAAFASFSNVANIALSAVSSQQANVANTATFASGIVNGTANISFNLAGDKFIANKNFEITGNLTVGGSGSVGNISSVNTITVETAIATGSVITGNVFTKTLIVDSITANIWNRLYSSNVVETTNLFFTNVRTLQAIVPLLTTANVIETTNQYFTNVRVLQVVNPLLTTANVIETTNQYFTNVRTLQAVVPLLTTANVVEDTNQYFTNVRTLQAVVPLLTTANVVEDTNQYFTNARVTGALVGTNVVLNNLIVMADLEVRGNVTTINTNTLDIEDKNITIGKGTVSPVEASGAGIHIDGAQANITYNYIGDKLEINKAIDVQAVRILAETEAANNSTFGALTVAGGAYVGGNLIVSDSAFVGNDPVITLNPLNQSLAVLRSQLEAPPLNVIYVAKHGDDNNSGVAFSNALANIHVALARATPWTTVFVKSGEYVLHNQPVTIKNRVGLVGDNLRTTTIRPSNTVSDMFYVENASYVTGITFRDHEAPAAVFSFNPDGSAGTIVTSPYIQNSSSITTTGTGMRVDGRYVSGLRSMVCDSYTQTNAGGIGIHMLNRGYTQLVSVFTICCDIAILCENGGFCSITNSNSSFGNYGLVARGVSQATGFGYLNGAQDGQEFAIYGLSRRPNYRDAVLFANYDQAKCSRDAGLIADSLAIDLAYGSNTQSTFSGIQYWSQTESAIPNQSEETLAAINYAKSVASNVVSRIRITDLKQSNVAQVYNSNAYATGTVQNVAASNANIGFFFLGSWAGNPEVGMQLIQPGWTVVGQPTWYVTETNETNQTVTIAGGEFITGVAYSFKEAGPAGTSAANVSIEFDLIANIIVDGTVGVTDRIIPNGVVVTTDAGINNTANLLASNKSFVAAETVAWVRQTYPGFFDNPANFIDQANAEAKCSRDVGYMIDSINFDLLHGGNRQAVTSGVYYYNYSTDTSQINDQVVATGKAYDFIGELITRIVQNRKNSNYDEVKCERDTGLIVDAIAFDLAYGGNTQSTFAGLQYWSQTESAIPNQSVETLDAINFVANTARSIINGTYAGDYQNNTSFTSGTTDSSGYAANVLTAKMSLIVDIIDNGTVGVTDRITQNDLLATSNVVLNDAANIVIANKTFIAAETIGYINQTYPNFWANTVFIDQANALATCSRDVGYILDSALFDVLHGGNRQSVQAGTYYYTYNANVTQINEQFVQTGQAYDYIGQIANKVIRNKKHAAYDQDKCERDTGLIVDAVALDLLYPGTSQSKFAGLQYWSQTESAIPNQAPETIAAIKYAKRLASNVVQNISIASPKQLIVSQVSGTGATAAEAARYDTNFDFITGVITDGTVGVTDRIVKNDYFASTNVNVNNGANLIVANKDFIKAEVIAFVNQTYPGFFANASHFIDQANAETRCSRDVGYILDSLTFDLLHGGNKQTVQSAVYYYNYSANVTQINDQIVKTGQAYDFIATKINEIITSNVVATYQTLVQPNNIIASKATSVEASNVIAKISFINGIIAGGPTVAGAKTPIGLAATTDANVINAVAAIEGNRDFLKAETIAYVNTTMFKPPFQMDVQQNTTAYAAATLAEANLILEKINIIKNIIINGPTVAQPKLPIGSTLNSNANAINAAKILEINRDYIKAETIAYVNEVIFDPPYQTAVKQNTTAAPAATLAEANIVLNNITLIKNIIANGPTVAPAKTPINANVSIAANALNAAKIILANRDYIRAETIAFTNRNWANIAGNAATYYTVASSTELVGNSCTITLLENILDPIRSNVSISFHSPSYIQTSTHTFEYIGSGTDLARALPYNGGLPIQGNEVQESGGGAVYFTSTDQQGDFRIGKDLLFNRVDGTITGRTFNKSLFAVMTPYILAIEG